MRLYVAYLIAIIVMTLSVLEGYSLSPAFSNANSGICGMLHGPSASTELLV